MYCAFETGKRYFRSYVTFVEKYDVGGGDLTKYSRSKECCDRENVSDELSANKSKSITDADPSLLFSPPSIVC